ncbi:ankyrin repeat-containing protein [Prunus yedoensis var. nudiflora]|uniref:Ankyrin repeat-containing protein n=1 Tax=Prunus yedoensis var. nudiflora TaxID=2094558 RepID=A0A314Y6B2_PRUYE|nr:ankyrin repeat-containing protein [Prunus yedoensis var. nudiflora]
MDPSVYEAAESGDVGFFRRADASIDLLCQKTPAHNSIFHIAAEYKQIHFFRDVLDDPSLLFWAPNKKGNTPLHVAARVGCDEIVKLLIEHAKKLLHIEGADEERGPSNGEANKLLRMTNFQEDTALHVAARCGHVEVVNLLMAEDPGLCCLINFNKEFPLFLATRHGFPLVARSILNECPISPSFKGFNDVTTLHVAVTYMDEEWKGIVETMVSKYPDIIKRVDDALGWTSLHYAAFGGNLEATQLLMQRDSSVSYILDKSGMSALHVAAYAGHTDVMEEMIRTKNEADVDGNTPLHLAAIKKNPEIIRALTGDPRVDKIATNRKFSQAYDICLSQDIGEQEIFGSSSPRVLDNLGSSIGLPYFHGQIRRDFWNVPEKDTIEGEKEHEQRRGSRLLIATVVAGITFAATFVDTGASGSNGRRIELKVFYFLNLLSFFSSFFVIYNETVGKNLVMPTRSASKLTRLSASAMLAANSAWLSATQKGDTKQSLRGSVKFIMSKTFLVIYLYFLPEFAEALRMKEKQRQLYNRGFSFSVWYVLAYIRKKFQKQHAS